MAADARHVHERPITRAMSKRACGARGAWRGWRSSMKMRRCSRAAGRVRVVAWFMRSASRGGGETRRQSASRRACPRVWRSASCAGSDYRALRIAAIRSADCQPKFANQRGKFCALRRVGPCCLKRHSGKTAQRIGGLRTLFRRPHVVDDQRPARGSRRRQFGAHTYASTNWRNPGPK